MTLPAGAARRLTPVERRGVDVDQQLGTGGLACAAGSGANILTDGQANGETADIDNTGFSSAAK